MNHSHLARLKSQTHQFIMNSSNIKKSNPIAGCRARACCVQLSGCVGHRSKFDIASALVCFGGNSSSSGNNRSHFGFRKCNGARCKIKCRENHMLIPLNSFRGRYSQHGCPVLTDEHLDCKSKNVVQGFRIEMSAKNP